MLDLLKTHFGFDCFRGAQEEVVKRVCSGRDALVVMPTGGGKSLCYQLPALARNGTAVVVSPLISLMKDQVDALRAHGIAAAALNSTLFPDEVEAVVRSLRSGRLKLLYVAPERLATPFFRELLEQFMVSLVAVDEAHCISEWGHDFRPEYRQLASLRTLCPASPLVALTATATEAVQNDILKQLRIDRKGLFVSGFDRPNLRYAVLPKKGAFEMLVQLLARHPGASSIVYCLSRKRTEEVAASLRERGIAAEPYHAGLVAGVRASVQDRFIKDHLQVVVATVAFGMGIDKPDVRLVVHYDLPKSVEGYYQETGRAGRDGLPAECFLLYSYGDTRIHQYFLAQAAPKERALGEQKLRAMVAYAEHPGCRRSSLLSYFGQSVLQAGCGNCDTCLGWRVPAVRAIFEAGPSMRKKAAPASDALNEVDRALFERLRILRRALADERNVPPYVVFGDKSLLQMAAERPRTRDAFSRITGVGTRKLEEFAAIFLAEIGA